jgi:hypothetical protein
MTALVIILRRTWKVGKTQLGLIYKGAYTIKKPKQVEEPAWVDDIR